MMLYDRIWLDGRAYDDVPKIPLFQTITIFLLDKYNIKLFSSKT